MGERKFGLVSTKGHVGPVPASRARKIASIILLSLLCSYALSLSPGCGNDDQGADARGDSGFSGETVRRLDGAIDKQMREEDLPGVVVGVWVPGKGHYVEAKGKANLKTGEQRDLDDPFRIGSITKTFVATAVLQLVEEGKLSKSDKLSEWYPDFPNADKITIEDLLRMQSGIVDPPFEDLVRRYTSPSEAIEASARSGAFFPPAQRTQYSNINYVILGEIVSKVSGNDTGDQIEESILKPLGMRNTFYPTDSDLPGDLHGYTYDFSTGGLKDVTVFDPAAEGGAGAMISDVSDLRTWAKAVCTGTLLKPEKQKARLQTKPLSGESGPVRYGEGIMRVGKFYGHPGIQPGFSSAMWYLPQKEATIIINVNRADEFDPPPSDALAGAIVKILFPEYAV